MSRQEITYHAGEVIFKEGYPSDNAYIVVDGEVEIYREPPGEEEQHLAFLKAGEMFGEYGVLDDAPRSASARAHTDCVLQILEI